MPVISIKAIACKRRFRRAFYMLAAGLYGIGLTPVHAEDLLQLWKIAEQNDAKYQAARHKYLADQELSVISRADLLPDISFQYEYKETDQTVNRSDNDIFASGSDKYPTDTYGIRLTQSVFDYSRWQRYAGAQVSTDLAKVELDQATQDLMLRLSENYFLVLERGDQLDTIQSEKTAMQKHLETSEKKLKSGLGRRVDVEDARARYLNALSKEAELQSGLLDSRYQLREVLGMIPDELSALQETIVLEMPKPADPQEWVEMSVQRNLDLLVKNLELSVADKEIRALRGGHFPTVDLLLSLNNVDTEGSVFGGGSDVDTTEVMLQFNVPIYSGGETSARLRQGLENRNTVLQERNDTQRSVERSAHDAFYRINSAIIQIEALEQSVRAQQRLVNSRDAGYRAGQDSLVGVLDAQRDLSLAQQALTKARYDYVLNVLRLKATAGDLQLDDLALVNSWLVN
jgi:outer membrane protein